MLSAYGLLTLAGAVMIGGAVSAIYAYRHAVRDKSASERDLPDVKWNAKLGRYDFDTRGDPNLVSVWREG